MPMTRLPSWLFTFRPVALLLVLLVAAAAAVTRMVPYEYRPMNFAAIGAVALFAAARVGLLPAILAVVAAMGISDYYLARTIYHAEQYSPAWSVYCLYLVYAGLGWWLLRHTEHPLRIGAAALSGSVIFFLVTNFLSWKGQALPYPQTFAGLMDSYAMALPFFRGTLLSDLGFTALLFGAHAVLVRSLVPDERVVPAAVAHYRETP
jgi:hypothetical protein